MKQYDEEFCRANIHILEAIAKLKGEGFKFDVLYTGSVSVIGEGEDLDVVIKINGLHDDDVDSEDDDGVATPSILSAAAGILIDDMQWKYGGSLDGTRKWMSLTRGKSNIVLQTAPLDHWNAYNIALYAWAVSLSSTSNRLPTKDERVELGNLFNVNMKKVTD